jgi:hypothetical protein
MQRIEHSPPANQVVNISVAKTLSNDAVTSLEVTLRAVSTVADPIQFVVDNDLWQEILSKGGLDEDLTYSSAVLDSSRTVGWYNFYTILYDMTSPTTC